MQPRLFSSQPRVETNRHAARATALRVQAMRLLGSPERDQLLREAAQCDRDARLAAYLDLKDPEPPT